MSAKGSTAEDTRFIDALRDALGLEPLERHKNKAPGAGRRREVERFYCSSPGWYLPNNAPKHHHLRRG